LNLSKANLYISRTSIDAVGCGDLGSASAGDARNVEERSSAGSKTIILRFTYAPFLVD